MALIGKRTKKITKEAQAQKIFDAIAEEKKEELYILLGKIVAGKVKNFYSTRIFKSLAKDLEGDQRAVVSYMCQKAAAVKMFNEMEKLKLTEGK